MGHDHGLHGHSHAPAGVSTRTLAAAVVVTLLFVFAEAAAGWWAQSLALLSDALHNLADAAALALSWYGLRIAARPSHHGMTFGYHRVGILAALVNAVSLVVIAVFIAWEAVARLLHPAPADGGLMIVVAAAAVVINTTISLWLRRAAADDVNVRSAYLHMVGDAVSAAGVLVAGAIVLWTGSAIADPAVSLAIAVLILWSSWGLLRQTTAVLLEGTP
ncbi:MAG: cation diffusion facilitator family transporter, partial [Acidobacteriota bacterium]